MSMQNFTFSLPTEAVFGKGQIAALPKHIPADKKILITYGGGSVHKNGVMQQVKDALTGYTYFEFGGIEPNPGYETLMKAVSLAREKEIDFLLAVGGGSVLDGTKFIAAAINYESSDPWDILLTGGRNIKSSVPLGCVLTLPATGSEMNSSAVISRYETGDKLAFAHASVRPMFAILDPETTYSLPKRQIANGVIDAFVHTAEQYMTYPVDAKIPDRFAEGVFLTLIEEGPRALENPEDYSIRANIMWACTMALNRILATGVPQDWVSHQMGHEMTAAYGVDHAQSLSVTLPAVWTYCKKDKMDKMLQFAERVFGITQGTDDERYDLAVAKTKEFFEKMGNGTTFEDYGADPEKIPLMVEKLRQHTKTSIGERGNISSDDMEKIYYLGVKK